MLCSKLDMSVRKIKTLEEIVHLRTRFRESGKKLVFTNGCFDLLHIGHVRYLNQARSMGDALVVGVNSDSSVRIIKGDLRPVVPESERAEIIAALSSVDYVFIFADPTPQRVIDAIVPDVLVKGGEYKVEDIVGYDVVKGKGGTVLTIDMVEGFSSTGIIQKMKGRS